MIQAISIRHFQSLHHVDLELAPFTVIVGPSSSGKSAFTRALRTLTSNQRGHAFITTGERITTIKATTERGTVTLKRGKTTGDNEYAIIPVEGPPPKPWTKLGADVPAEVSAFIGIEPKEPINYAGQFDRPYLLGNDTSAGEVARVLGALTNVSVIFDGARESNRRKLDSSKTLKLRASDIEAINTKVEDYRPLTAQLAAITEAETALATAQRLQVKRDKLARAIEIEETASAALERLEDLASAPEITDADIAAANESLTRFRSILSTIKARSAEAKQAAEAVEQADADLDALEKEYLDLLTSAGTCPTCGQGTKELTHAHR